MQSQLNSVELIGVIGSVNPITVGHSQCYRISLVTNRAIKDVSGFITVECTWHLIKAFPGPGREDLDKLAKGDGLHVKGRLRTVKQENGDTTFTTYEVVPSSIEKLNAATLTIEL